MKQLHGLLFTFLCWSSSNNVVTAFSSSRHEAIISATTSSSPSSSSKIFPTAMIMPISDMVQQRGRSTLLNCCQKDNLNDNNIQKHPTTTRKTVAMKAKKTSFAKMLLERSDTMRAAGFYNMEQKREDGSSTEQNCHQPLQSGLTGIKTGLFFVAFGYLYKKFGPKRNPVRRRRKKMIELYPKK